MSYNNDGRDNTSRNERVKNFRLNIQQEDLSVGEQYRNQEGINESEVSINSFSNDGVKTRMEKKSKHYAKEMKKEKKRQEKLIDKANTRIFRIVWWVSVAMVGLMLGIYLMTGLSDLLALDRLDENTVKINIPANPTIEQISEELYDKGVIKEKVFFSLYSNLTGNSQYFTQGKYEIKTNMDYEAIINYLQSMANRTDTVKVTIPEGESVLRIAEILKEAKVLSDVDRFLELCNSDYFDEDYDFIRDIKNGDKRYYKLEGYLFPDTYECYVNERPELTITRMLNVFEMRVYYDQNVEGYRKPVNIAKLVEKSDYSLDEILNIASIIQAEAANADDMYYISSILHNRLEADVDSGVSKLGLDSTLYYPYHDKKSVPEEKRDNFESTYNTYNFNGLPAGAINNPGMEAILAAIYPNDTSYMYFCHSKKGTPYYASTLYEHNLNLSWIG